MKPTRDENLCLLDEKENWQLGVLWYEAMGYKECRGSSQIVTMRHKTLPITITKPNPATDANAAREVLEEIERRGPDTWQRFVMQTYRLSYREIHNAPSGTHWSNIDHARWDQFCLITIMPHHIVQAALLAVFKKDYQNLEQNWPKKEARDE